MSLFLIPNPNKDLFSGDTVLFVHLTKTGGTSIRRDRQLNVAAEFYDPPSDWEYEDSFAVIRNPYDRAVSAYIDFKYNRKMTEEDVGIVEWLNEHHDKDLDNPGSAGHHCSSIHQPVHGLKHADKLISFDKYPFDRHERPSPGEDMFKLNDYEKSVIEDLFAADFATWEVVK